MMKKFVLALIVSLCLVVPVKVNAVELEKSFETSFDLSDFSVRIYSMTSYDDSGNVDGYIIYSEGREIYRKYDLNNKLVWNKSNIVVKELNVTINNNDLLIKRINPDTKEVIWQKEYGGSGREELYQYFYSYDNSDEIDGYFIIFNTESLDIDIEPGYYIMKYDLDGNVILKKKIKVNFYGQGYSYVKNSNNDYIRYHTNFSMNFWRYYINNISKNERVGELSFNMSGYGSALIINESTNSDFIIYDGISFNKYTLLGEKISTKKLDISLGPYSTINSKTILGNYDGFIVASGDSPDNIGIFKFDYDGNLLWKHLLSYLAYGIDESYDSAGEFNGYIVTGYDSDNKKGYITKFTYPKKVIESKNSDVEVISDAYPGKTVTVKAKEKTGYVVKKVIVRDSSGKEIEVSNDGTFVMPDDDVSIEVVYEKKVESIITNPKTSSALCVALAIISLSLLGTFIVKNRKDRGESL